MFEFADKNTETVNNYILDFPKCKEIKTVKMVYRQS